MLQQRKVWVSSIFHPSGNKLYKGLHLKSTSSCAPGGSGLNRFVSWAITHHGKDPSCHCSFSQSSQWASSYGITELTSCPLPQSSLSESHRGCSSERPRRHKEQSVPTARNVTSRKSLFRPSLLWLLVAILAGGRRARLEVLQFRILMAWVLAVDSMERSRDCSLGGWNPNSANHWLCDLGQENYISLIGYFSS